MAKKRFSFSESIQEVQSILEDISSENVSIDALHEKVKRANELLSHCKEKLRSTEDEINKVFDDDAKSD